MIQLLVRWSVLALGVTLATKLVPGIQCNDASTLLIVVVLLSFLNAVLKPLLVLFIVFTLGLGIVLINAFLFLLVSRVVDGFYVVSFGSAFFGGDHCQHYEYDPYQYVAFQGATTRWRKRTRGERARGGIPSRRNRRLRTPG